MASISKAIDSRCKKHAYGDGDSDWFGCASTACIEGCYQSGGRDSSGFAQVAYREGDDDDGDAYDYAPAA